MWKRALAEVFDHLERFVKRSNPSDSVDRECPHLFVRRDIRKEIQPTLRIDQIDRELHIWLNTALFGG